MRHILTLFSGVAVLLGSCTGETPKVDLQPTVDSLYDVVAQQKDSIEHLEQIVKTLRFPADQRLAKIKGFIAAEQFSKAKNAIASLKSVFPQSVEAAQCDSLSKAIDDQLAAIEAEKQRIKALGFKALKTATTTEVGYNKVTFSSINVGTKFVHDVYPTYTGSEWREHTADRDNKYITCAMDVTSTSKDPGIPTLAFYTINGDKLVWQGDLRVQMARWQDYGTYLGNEPDLNNDFSKVSTVKFKLGLELPETDFSKPYILVLKKENTQIRHTERMRNPPVYYTGEAGYPAILTIDDFSNGGYVAIKIANL